MLFEEEKSPPGLTNRQSTQLRAMFSCRGRMRRKMKALPSALGIFRPVVGQCCQQCLPKSLGRRLLQPSLGFWNMLKVTETCTRYRGWLVRRLSCVLFVSGCRVYPDTAIPDRVQRVWSSDRVQKVLSVTDKVSEGKGKQQCLTLDNREQASHILALIRVHMSPLLLRVTCLVLLKLLNFLFYSIQVNISQMSALQRAAELGCPLVFVSQQKCGLDSTLISLVLFAYKMRVPYTVCHAQPSNTCLRWVLQRLGVVFSPQKDAVTEALHRAIMTSFIAELLREGRSLSLALAVDTGQGVQWLAWVQEALKSGAVSDVSLVPVGIDYDHPPQHGLSGQGLLSLMQSLMSLLWKGRQGGVRIHFGQAFSLKEMCQSGRWYTDGTRPLQELLLPTILDKSTDSLYRSKSMSWILPPSCCPELTPSERQAFVLRFIATAACTAIMSTSLLSCLLLHKHRKGVRLSQLFQDIYWLLQEVVFRNRDVGFGGSLPQVVYHALSLLSPYLVLAPLPPLTDPLLALRPSPNATLALAQHCLLLTRVFAAEAMGACAVLSILRDVSACGGGGEMEFDVSLHQEELLERILQVCHLLPAEYFPPCQSAHNCALDAMDSLVRCGILFMEERPQDQHVYDFWKRHGTLIFSSADDADYSDSDCEKQELCCYKISQHQQSQDLFFFLCSLLSVHMRALYWAVEGLEHLHRPLPEQDFVMWLHHFLCDRAGRGQRQYESSSADMVRVTVRTFIDLGVLEEEKEGERGGVYLGLSPLFQEPATRMKLHRFIQQFVYN